MSDDLIDKALYPFDNTQDLKKHLKKVISQAKYELVIFSHILDAPFFSDDDIVNDLSSLVRQSARARVRIVINDPQSLVECQHKILALSRRLVSKIQIQKIIIEAQSPFEFVIADNNKIWLRHDNKSSSGFANYDARPEAKRFLFLFEEYWKYSEEDVRLRHLNL